MDEPRRSPRDRDLHAERPTPGEDRRYRELVERVPVGIFEAGPDGACTFVNRRGCEILGMRPEHAYGFGWAAAIHAEDRAHVLARWDEATRHGRAFHLEFRVQRTGGEVTWVDAEARAIRDETGHPSLYLGTLVDLTGRHSAEETLRESEERHRSVVDALDEGIVVQDASGRVVTWNGAALRILGLPAAELAGFSPAWRGLRTVREDGSPLPPVEHPAAVTLRTGTALDNVPVGVHRPDGRLVWLTVNTRPLVRAAGTAPHAVLATFTDVTAARATEAELEEVTAFQDLLFVLSTHFAGLSPESIDPGIEAALRAIGEFLRVDRACVYRLDVQHETLATTHEWCAEGIEPRRDTARSLPIVFGAWMERVRRVESLQVVRVDDLEPGSEEQEVLDALGARAMVAVPLVDRRGLFGILGLEAVRSDPRWSPRIRALLHGAGDLVANTLARRAVEESLHASEERFHALVHASSDIVSVLDPDGTWRYSSPAATRLLGHPSGELPDGDLRALVHPDDLRAVEVAFRRALRRGPGQPGQPVEIRVRAVEGDWHWFETVFTNLVDNPSVRGVVLNSRDVTGRRRAEEALRQSEERFRALVQGSSDITVVLDGDGTVRYVSPAAERVLGRSQETILHTSAFDLVHPDDLDAVLARFSSGVEAPGSEATLELRMLHAGGQWRDIEAVGTNLLHDPAVAGVVINARDVTERKAAERKAARLAAVLESTSDFVVLARADGRITYLNGVAADFFGARHAGDLRLPQLLVPESRERLAAEVLPEILRRGLWSGELTMLGAPGVEIPAAVTLHGHQDESHSVEIVSLIAHDITALKEAEARLEHQAYHDPLTALPNRARFRRLLDEAWSRRSPEDLLGVVSVDLDRFKAVNDTLGHDAGDQLLLAVSRRLRQAVRHGDAVARLGGDEFVVIAEGLRDREEVLEIANRIVAALSREFVLAAGRVGIGASAGVAVDDGQRDVEDLLRQADVALYRAKDDGRSRAVLFDPDAPAGRDTGRGPLAASA